MANQNLRSRDLIKPLCQCATYWTVILLHYMDAIARSNGRPEPEVIMNVCGTHLHHHNTYGDPGSTVTDSHIPKAKWMKPTAQVEY
jgi:hypothetical protein